ncbi:hypothetical protein LCGC14_1524560, partial [marine sediment metagenome]
MTTPHHDEPGVARKRPILGGLRANFLTGVVVILPIALTMWLIYSVIGWIDSWVLPFIPSKFRPEQYIGINLRGVGVIIFFIFTIIVGWLAKGLIGRSLLRWGETLVNRMPVVRTVYSGVKQIAETVFAQTESSFEKACLVEYPRRGIWAIAFVSTAAKGEIGTEEHQRYLTAAGVLGKEWTGVLDGLNDEERFWPLG